MSIPKEFIGLYGNWKGNNRLHLSWLPDPVLDSEGTASVTPRIADQFVEIAYRWSHEGSPQEGMIILGGDNKTDAINAAWTDSWHMAHQLMMCEGKEYADGRVSVNGFYKVEGHPDWGWRTEINPGESSFTYKMYNVSPEGQEEIAVEMEMSRE